MSKLKKLTNKVSIHHNILDYLEGSIEDAIDYLLSLKDRHKNKKLYLETDYDYDDLKVLGVHYEEEESDKDYNKRVELDKKQKDDEKIKRKEQYDKLKKEFGE